MCRFLVIFVMGTILSTNLVHGQNNNNYQNTYGQPANLNQPRSSNDNRGQNQYQPINGQNIPPPLGQRSVNRPDSPQKGGVTEMEYLDIFEIVPTSTIDVFDWKLFKDLVKYNTDNLLVSPFSLKMAMVLLYEAANDTTADEIRLTMDFPSDKGLLRKKFTGLLNYLKSPPAMEYILEVGNRMYLDQYVKPEQKYGATLQYFYHTDIIPIDINYLDITTQDANAWVRNMTRGNIDSFLSPGDLNDVVILLLSTVYFNGTWENQFDVRDTKLDKFNLASQEPKSVNVDFMTQTDSFLYYESSRFDAKILTMPYKGNKLYMLFILPNSVSGMKTLIDQISPMTLHREMQLMQKTTVRVIIPKFKFEFESHFMSTFENLGIKSIFENTASLPGLARGRGLPSKLSVSNILQKAGIEVNENGTTAYAATSISLVNKFGDGEDSPEEFRANRPFLYLIVEEFTKQILFLGAMTNPQIGSGKFQHSNEDKDNLAIRSGDRISPVSPTAYTTMPTGMFKNRRNKQRRGGANPQ